MDTVVTPPTKTPPNYHHSPPGSRSPSWDDEFRSLDCAPCGNQRPPMDDSLNQRILAIERESMHSHIMAELQKLMLMGNVIDDESSSDFDDDQDSNTHSRPPCATPPVECARHPVGPTPSRTQSVGFQSIVDDTLRGPNPSPRTTPPPSPLRPIEINTNITTTATALPQAPPNRYGVLNDGEGDDRCDHDV